MRSRRSSLVLFAAAGLFAAAFAKSGCGDGDRLDDETSTFDGNVSSAQTAARAPESPSWLGRLYGDWLGLLRTAHAQGGDVSLSGIVVSVIRDETVANATTDESGGFEVEGAPTGDVTVTFRREDCEAELPFPAVVEGSRVTLVDVDFPCADASPERTVEEFRGVVHDEAVGDAFEVCVAAGDGHRVRRVETADAEVRDEEGDPIPVGELREGDEVLLRGERITAGSPDSFDADRVGVVQRSQTDPCGGDPFPTPTFDPDEPSPTPGPGDTPTPVEPTPTGPDPDPTPTVPGPTPTTPPAEPTGTPTPDPEDPLAILTPLLGEATPTPTEPEPTPTVRFDE